MNASSRVDALMLKGSVQQFQQYSHTTNFKSQESLRISIILNLLPNLADASAPKKIALPDHKYCVDPLLKHCQPFVSLFYAST